MATLVLSTVGRYFGGPAGAAVGASVGQVIDREVLFKQKREGPRLTELAVQTSSYGAPVPLVFGTMRVAGCVIWSTDLLESRSRSGGKGQPTTTNYSYAVSFAVALSGRPISDVARIWADGKLLRGAAGDFKTATGFRLHKGREGQAVDPLIASAEGTAMTPAHRGVAYAVFENFQLADYGNRIPSLTFEVIGDDASVRVGAIVGELSGGVIDGAAGAQAVPGFAAYGSARGVAEMLAGAVGAWFVPEGSGLRLADARGVATAITDKGSVRRKIAAIGTVPRALSLAHYDAARDYQTGVQRAVRPGAGVREERIELPASLSAETAKGLAEAILARTEAGRERRSVTLGWHKLGVVPGACVTIDDVAGRWRVTGWSLEAMVLTLECVRLSGASVPVAAADPGRVLGAVDRAAGVTILRAFELPSLDDNILSTPRLSVVAAGSAPGWRRAALLYSSDGGVRWTSAGPTAAPGVIGTVVTPPGAGPSTIVDWRNVIELDLVHDEMRLEGAEPRALDGGANLARMGGELVQFELAEQVGARRWRLSRLRRGRRGTEAAISGHATGEAFVLIDPETIVAIDLPRGVAGTNVRVVASGIGDVVGPAAVDALIDGASMVPPAPVGLSCEINAVGDAAVQWIRRSRDGWGWIDGADAPLAEERELYRVTMTPASGAARTVERDVPTIIVPAADRVGGVVRLSVRQAGSHGESRAAVIDIPGI